MEGAIKMVDMKLYENITDTAKLLFVDIVAKHNGHWVLCRKKGSDTWECPGGHIEENETSLQAANRELWEETGATGFTLYPIGFYGAKGSDGILESQEEVFGQIYYADIKIIEEFPDYEMEQIQEFDILPENWSYPYAHPMFIDLAQQLLSNSDLILL